MNQIKKIPCKYGLTLFIALQIMGYALDIKGLKLVAFYNEGLEMQISIVAIVLPLLVEGFIYFRAKRANEQSK